MENENKDIQNENNKDIQKTCCEGDERLSSFLIPYFNYLREEINQRVKQHSYLVIYKIISIGATFSFLINWSGKSVENFNKFLTDYPYFFWIVPLIGIIFDVIILGNLRVVFNIGLYIKKEYEVKLFYKWSNISKCYPNDFQFWESVGARESSTYKWRCYSKFDMTIIYSITGLSIILLLIMLPGWQNVVLGIIALSVSLIIYGDMLLLVSGKDPSIIIFIKSLFEKKSSPEQ